MTRRSALVFQPHRQSGSVLAISLIILLLMTILSVTAMQGTTMQERMAGNQRDHNLAFQAAEAALRAGEAWLIDPDNGVANRKQADNGSPLQNPTTWDGTDFDDTDLNAPVAYTGLGGGIAENPVFYVSPPRRARTGIEQREADDRIIYSITARGTGATESAVVVLESMYEPPR